MSNSDCNIEVPDREAKYSPLHPLDPAGVTRVSSDISKMTVLKSPWHHPPGYVFPINNQNRRRYTPEWEEKYHWIRYSPSQDGVYCIVCRIFASSSSHGNSEFISNPFRDWKNARGEKGGRFPKHDSLVTHLTSMTV